MFHPQDELVFKMIYPELNSIKGFNTKYNYVPICKEINADMATPVVLLKKFSGAGRELFLLEGVEYGEKWSRYSYLGIEPSCRITCKNGIVTVDGNEIPADDSSKPMETVKRILSLHKSPKIPGMPDFTGGFAGYFAYSLICFEEPSLKIKMPEKDFDLLRFDKIIVYDNLKHSIIIIVNINLADTDLDKSYSQALSEIARLEGIICDRALPSPHGSISSSAKSEDSTDCVKFTCEISENKYYQMIEHVKKHIRNGEILQAIISRQFKAKYDGSLINAYRILRGANPTPYMNYMHFDDLELICFSPSTLARIRNGRVSTLVVAGTSPRGSSPEEDLIIKEELLGNKKEVSEHEMLIGQIVDELGRFTVSSGIQITEHMLVRMYAKIMHLVSKVEVDMRPESSPIDAITAFVPTGAVSGRPKKRACEIIDEIESLPRGIYAGALAYIGFNGNMDACVAIRMAIKENGIVTIQTGDGIVEASDPILEYEEAGHKAEPLINAVVNSDNLV